MTIKTNFLMLFCLIGYLANAQVQITGFSPQSGSVGTAVTVNCSGHDLTSSNNLVYFGGTSATVLSAAANTLTVSVPVDISGNSSITILNTVTGLQGSTDQQFVVTFNHGIFTTSPAANQFVAQTVNSVGPNLFGENTSFMSGKKMLSGDFDLDGKLDFAAMGTTASNNLDVFRNTNATTGAALSSSSFASPVSVTLDANTTSTACFPYDIDNDGKLDILLGRTDGFSVLRNTSSGSGNISFSKTTYSPGSTYASERCIAADLDLDGDLDIIGINPNGGTTLSIYINSSTPGSLSISVTPTNISLSQSVGDVLAADINGDGDKEIIVVSNANSGSSSSFESLDFFENTNSSAGTLSMSGTATNMSSSIPGGNFSMSVPLSMADFDLDGDMDFVTVAKGGFTQPTLVQVHRNDGSGVFTSLGVGSFYYSTALTYMVRTGDINGDGKIDIVFHEGNSSGDLQAILNTYSSGTLSASNFTAFSAITNGSYISVGFVLDDFNQDGKIDIISNEYYSSDIHFVTNGPATYYAKASAPSDLYLTSSWSTLEDGTGTSPANFNSGLFFLNNSTGTTDFVTGGDLSIGGTLVVPLGKTLTISASSTLEITGKLENSGYIKANSLSNLTLDAPVDIVLGGDMNLNDLSIGSSVLNVTLTGTDTINGTLTLASNKTLNLHGSTLTLKGDIDNSGTIRSLSANTLILEGSSTQTLAGDNSLDYVMVNNPSGIVFAGTDSVNNTLELNYGNVSIGTSDLYVKEFAGGSNTSYVQTDGTGKVTVPAPIGLYFKIPVGNSDYNPVYITNNNDSDDYFNFRVVDEVYSGGTNGTVLNSTTRVKHTWHIGKALSNTGTGVFLSFNWNSTEQSGAMFSPTLNHYNDTAWEIANTSYTNSFDDGMGNYTLEVEYQGGYSPFAIGEGLTPLPIEILEFKAIAEIDQVKLNWKASADHFKGSFEVIKSVDGLNWVSIGSIEAEINNNQIKSFVMYDRNPEELNYYRIIKREHTGASEPSSIVIVRMDQNQNVLLKNVYPNPSNGTINISVSTESVYSIYDATGRLINTGTLSDTTEIKDLQTGMYSLVITDGTYTESRLIKVN